MDPSKLRFFLLGPRFQGKTAFVSGTPRSLILDKEGGAWGIPTKFCRAARLEIKTYDDLLKIRNLLVTDGPSPKRPFDRVTIDTADSLVEMLARSLADQYSKDTNWKGTDIRHYGTKGAGYTILTEAFWGLLQSLERAGYSWTVVGHLKEETRTGADGKDITVSRPVLFPGLASMIAREADIVAAVEATTVAVPNFKTVTGTGQKIAVGVTQVPRVQFNAKVEIGSGTGFGKLRGVANMSFSFVLPDFVSDPATPATGWDEFVKEYKTATEKVSQGIFA
jgi:hypothetical protein